MDVRADVNSSEASGIQRSDLRILSTGSTIPPAPYSESTAMTTTPRARSPSTITMSQTWRL
jgi:hypothetical protein